MSLFEKLTGAGGPRNIIPGMLVFSALGACGSYMTQKSPNEPADKESKPKTSWLDSKWSPLKRLSDKEYEARLEEQILRIDADIAIIDENIQSLKASATTKDGTATTESSDSTKR